MSVSQTSVFLQSRPGHLARLLNVVETAGVNVRGFSASDTGDYGIVRFVFDDPSRALSALESAGYATTSTDVLCIRLNDEPGELARVLSILSESKVNVDYSYSLISTYIAVHTDDCLKAEQLLVGKPIEVLGQGDLIDPLCEDGSR